jgi:hypothetical protein
MVKFISAGSICILPVTYFLALTFGHRLNNTRLIFLPFLANLFPITGFLYIFYVVSDNHLRLTDSIVIYTSVLAILLTIGGISCIPSTFNRLD